MAKLATHYGWSANQAVKRRLIKDVKNCWNFLALEQFLTTHSQINALLNLASTRRFKNGSRIIVCLK